MAVLRRNAQIVNQRGLHARASAAFAREAMRYDARVNVRLEGVSANAASIMDLLMLGAHIGQVVEIETEGPDAEGALNALCALIERRFDEKE